MDEAREPDPVPLEITDELDLHSFAPSEILSVVEEYLRACREKGILEVRVVHGRGRGVQRAAVRRLLRGLPWVGEFREAPPASGGWGATLVNLRPISARAKPS